MSKGSRSQPCAAAQLQSTRGRECARYTVTEAERRRGSDGHHMDGRFRQIPDPQWIVGFVSAEGNFDVGIKKSKNKVGYQVYLRFRITQHERELKLMKLLIKYLGAGRIEFDRRVDASTITIVVGNYSDIIKKIIPFFDKYPNKGVKSQSP